MNDSLWFGGSFNPIHIGHLICARAVAEASNFARVVLVPCRQPPHKSGDTSVITPAHRLQMCRLAVANDPFFQVDDIEIQRPGPSYTIDTVRQLRSRGFENIHWLIGADMVISLPTWHEPASLLAETRFILMARPAWSLDWSTLPDNLQSLQPNLVPAPQVDMSSTLIRNRLRSGQSIRYLTPDAVVDYIRTNQLYAG